jgi:hypothetical protein
LREEHRLREFEKTLLRTKFGRQQGTEQNIIRGVKSRRMRWEGHEASMGRGEVHTEFWCANLGETNRLGDL